MFILISIIKDFLEVMSLLRIFGILLKGYKWVITYTGWLGLLSVGLVHKVQTIYSVEKLSKPKELCQPTHHHHHQAEYKETLILFQS